MTKVTKVTIEEPKIPSAYLDRLATQISHLIVAHANSDDYGHKNGAFIWLETEGLYTLKFDLLAPDVKTIAAMGKKHGLEITASGTQETILEIKGEGLTEDKIRNFTVDLNSRVLAKNKSRVGDQLVHSEDLLKAALNATPIEQRPSTLADFIEGLDCLGEVGKEIVRMLRPRSLEISR